VKIEIFGPGCQKCKKAEANVIETIGKLGISAEVVHVQDLKEIASRGILATPAVAIDGVVKLSGRVPTETMIRQWFGK